MELFVLTSDKEVVNEGSKLNKLFSAGLTTLHLRKPRLEIWGYRNLLDKIDPVHYKKIVVHFHHELCSEYGLKGIHVREKIRSSMGKDLCNYVDRFKENGFTASSSFHSLESIENCEAKFDYHLLSPVFNSISKMRYKGKKFNVQNVEKRIVGLGGINKNRIQKANDLGYDGIAVLGNIWRSKDEVQSFLALKNACGNIVKLEIN